MDWLIKVFLMEHLLSSDIPTNCRSWRTTEKKQMLLRELGIRGAITEPQFTGSDTSVCTEEVKTRLMELGRSF